MTAFIPEIMLIAFLGLLLVVSFAMKRQWRIEKRLTGLEESEPALTREKQLSLPFYQRALFPLFGRVAQAIEVLTPKHTKKVIDDAIRDAGLEKKISSRMLLGITGLCAVLVPLGIFIVSQFLGVGSVMIARLVVGVFFLTLLIPLVILYSMVQKRKEEIVCALPDMLDLLVVTVEAGYGFDAAVSYVVEKTEGPLSDEFDKALKQMRMGQLRRNVFREMAENTNVPELATFLSSISQADQLGVSVSNVLRVQSDSMRVNRRQKAEEKAMKAPIKMVFPLVFCIFPTLFIVLLGPAAIQIFRSFVR